MAGFRRFRSALAWGLKEVPVVFIEPELPRYEVLKVVLAENGSHRLFEPIETSHTIGKLIDAWEVPREQVQEEILPLLGLLPSRHDLQHQLRLSRLAEPLQRALAEFSEEIALGLTSWEPHEQEFFLELLRSLRPGRNKQRQLLRLLGELRDLQGRAPGWLENVWDESGCSLLENAQQLSPSDRFDKIWQALRKMRYPRLAVMEERQARLIKALGLAPALSLSLPAHFEGDSIEFRVRARGPEELLKYLESLSERARRGELDELFELL